MARYIPSSPPADIAPSERKVWQGLRSLDDEWVIHHSVEWQGEREGEPDDGEADFVLVHPDHGVIVVEVKGGDIDVTPDQWYSVNREGRHKIKNPFSQVQASKRALIAWLRQRLQPCPRIPFGHVVMFPDVSVLPKLGPEAPDEVAWRRTEINDAAVAIDALCSHWKLTVPMGEDLAQSISAALAPEGVIRVRRSDEVANINAQIEAWTREQAEVLVSSLDNERLLVLGGAGTGKTVLAMEQAMTFASRGDRVLLTCYNKPLGDHLRAQFREVPGVTAVHFHKLCTDVAQRAMEKTGNEEFMIPTPIPRSFWTDDAPALLVEACSVLGIRYDVILVDEGQDFAPTFFEALETLLEDSPENRWIVFADTHQAIYRDEWEEPFAGSRIRLRRNCRNTVEIAQRVSGVWGEAPDSRGAIGRPPEFLVTESMEGSRSRLKTLLHRLVNEGKLSPNQVTLLCQTKAQTRSLRGSVLAGHRLGASRDGGRVLVETIHRFKGLESDAVIVLLDTVHDDESRALAYIGVSRACAELFVLGPESVRSSINWG